MLIILLGQFLQCLLSYCMLLSFPQISDLVSFLEYWTSWSNKFCLLNIPKRKLVWKNHFIIETLDEWFFFFYSTFLICLCVLCCRKKITTSRIAPQYLYSELQYSHSHLYSIEKVGFFIGPWIAAQFQWIC